MTPHSTPTLATPLATSPKKPPTWHDRPRERTGCAQRQQRRECPPTPPPPPPSRRSVRARAKTSSRPRAPPAPPPPPPPPRLSVRHEPPLPENRPPLRSAAPPHAPPHPDDEVPPRPRTHSPPSSTSPLPRSAPMWLNSAAGWTLCARASTCSSARCCRRSRPPPLGLGLRRMLAATATPDVPHAHGDAHLAHDAAQPHRHRTLPPLPARSGARALG